MAKGSAPFKSAWLWKRDNTPLADTNLLTKNFYFNNRDQALNTLTNNWFWPNDPPSVTLSSPSDGGSTSDTTPDLVFTGTDPQSNDIRYNVQIDTSSDFDATPTSFGYTSLGASKLGPSQNKMYGSKFTSPANAGTVLRIKHAICSDIGTGKYYKVAIALASTGAIISNGISNPTEMPYSAGQIPSWATSTFSTNPTLSPNTDYILYIIHSDPDWSNYSAYDTGSANQYYFDSSNSYASPTDPTDAVNTGDDNGGPNTAKLSIYVEYTPTQTPVVNAVSGTDAGFSGSPDNSDPFASGQAVTYTVQSALSAGTYYWRVRGIDPTGSGNYGSWSSTRSFTITSGTATSDSRDFRITGRSTNFDSRDYRITGKSASNDSRDFRISGKASSNDSRDVRITGKSTNADSRDYRVTGKLTSNDSRDFRITGKATSNESRDFRITGKNTSNDNRDVRITAKSTSNDSRDVRLRGKNSSNDNRDVKVVGKNTSLDSKEIRIAGKITSSDAKDIRITGLASANYDTREMRLIGKNTSHDEVAVRVSGTSTSSSSKDLKIYGKSTNSDNRELLLSGKDTSNSSVDLKINAKTTSQDAKEIRVTGKSQSSDSVDVRLYGTTSSSSSTEIKMKGKDSSESDRGIKVSGGVVVSSERGVRVNGVPVGYTESSRGFFMKGGMVIDYDPEIIFVDGEPVKHIVGRFYETI